MSMVATAYKNNKLLQFRSILLLALWSIVYLFLKTHSLKKRVEGAAAFRY